MTVDSSQTRTDVGNYFISNYPPFSQWKSELAGEALAELNAPARPNDPLGIYLHIPFCRKRCKFCYFKVYTDKNANEIERYLSALAGEIEIYSRTPALAGREPRFAYFGGGTPSYLSEKQLASLVERIHKHIGWDKAEEVTFEGEPGTIRKSKLETLKEIGVTRLSLGVEHFNDAVLEANGRAHLSPEIYRAYEWAREVDFANINIDLIAGMVGETEEGWRDCVAKALELEPDSVTIYQMELPYNTVYSKEMMADGKASPVADWPTKRRWVDYAFEKFQERGYNVLSAYTVATGKKPCKFVYTDALWRGADMIGFGVSSFSHFGGVHYQNAHGIEDYISTIESGTAPIIRAMRLTDRQRLIRELVLQLKTGRIELAYFRNKFGAELVEEYLPTFDKLAGDGVLKLRGDAVELTRRGLLSVDSFLPEFFEPEQKNVRYA